MTAALETSTLAIAPRIPAQHLWVVPTPAPSVTGAGGAVKSVLDIVVALLLIVLAAPVLLLLALAVCWDGGPVFFRQTRVGLDGREFTMLKFRSMVVGAEARLATLLPLNDHAGPLFKMRNDPRVTRIGSLLRKFSLDELPQLFNVVGGSMSLVGPRPALPREVAAYDSAAARRLAVKPGLTGLWQVSGRSDLSWDEAIRLDLHYVERWTPVMDVAILARTAGAVLRGGGAY